MNFFRPKKSGVFVEDENPAPETDNAMLDQLQEQMQAMHAELQALKANQVSKEIETLTAKHATELAAKVAEIETLKADNAALLAKLSSAPASALREVTTEEEVPSAKKATKSEVTEQVAKAKTAEKTNLPFLL